MMHGNTLPRDQSDHSPREVSDVSSSDQSWSLLEEVQSRTKSLATEIQVVERTIEAVSSKVDLVETKIDQNQEVLLARLAACLDRIERPCRENQAEQHVPDEKYQILLQKVAALEADSARKMEESQKQIRDLQEIVAEMKADQLTPPGPTHKTFRVQWKDVSSEYVIAQETFGKWPLSMTAGKLLEEVVGRLRAKFPKGDCFRFHEQLKEGKPLLMLGDVALNHFPNMSLACLGVDGSPLDFGFEGSSC